MLTVRVFDAAQLGAEAMKQAQRTAKAAFDRIDIVSRWQYCASVTSPPESQPACAQPLAPAEVIVRLLGDAHSRSGDPLSLGHSYVDLEAQAGVLATVFVDRVTSTARRVRGDRATLLGRAIAHEIGHLLLGTTTHGQSGLMRAHWSDGDLLRAFNWGWWFSSKEGAAMRRGLARRWPLDRVVARLHGLDLTTMAGNGADEQTMP
jgi:hypothetical protein